MFADLLKIVVDGGYGVRAYANAANWASLASTDGYRGHAGQTEVLGAFDDNGVGMQSKRSGR